MRRKIFSMINNESLTLEEIIMAEFVKYTKKCAYGESIVVNTRNFRPNYEEYI